MNSLIPSLSIDPILFERITFSLGAFIVATFISVLVKNAFKVITNGVSDRKIIPVSLIAKTNTIKSLLFSLIDIFIYSITFLIILSHWAVDISPILTGAGILGIAISFGSQTLVKDIIGGIFVIVESQYYVGDMIEVNKIKGRVVKITLRLTVLKDQKGNKIFIPNSQIVTVTRFKEETPKILTKKK